MRPRTVSVLVSLLLFIASSNVCNGGKLKKDFYGKDCPRLEETVRQITWEKVGENRSVAAKLLRLHFHDCFVRGCDASLLLDSVEGNSTEKKAIPNGSVSGYEIIDEIKAKLEEECPNTVSCADIVALAARDAVSYQFGRSMWQVFTGRKDGKVSLATEAARDLPSAFANYTTLKQQFANKGLNVFDLLALSGKGDKDPALDSSYAKVLKTKCSNPPNPNITVELDRNSEFRFDSHYFVALNRNQSLLASDAALLTDRNAARIARDFENFFVFMSQFSRSIKKMSEIGVITRVGDKGEIRKNCRKVNA
ncbi:hypothetical protein FEM48_Zijuj12G0179500 [Ziziphus jujuba var. spinosa]|uniref:Peroxidase n=1 Tax=Ziziphus jujuba var. spinosa TaxID=714518 RepID=A0A978UES6_ZIZJJ|nr:hypothetical protein FEM48_Zijuj12G0179500 [Ziziphus jujuba var. spinosa]